MQTRIELTESRVLRVILALQCTLALTALWLAQVPAIALLIVGGLLSALLFRRKRTPHALCVGNGLVRLELEEGVVPVRLHPECHCHPWLIVLRFSPLPGEYPPALLRRIPRVLVLLPDSAPRASLRLLRVCLRWQVFAAEEKG